jgi:23S rRNA (adenine2030-N6)-methyltransferase
MVYRHSRHAGNFGDVLKHWTLLRFVGSLQAKFTALNLLDTHAGRGLYRLDRPGEFHTGIGRLWPGRAQWPWMADYFGLIRAHNPNDHLAYYPGSPCLLHALARPADRLLLIEQDLTEFSRLERLFEWADSQVTLIKDDAWCLINQRRLPQGPCLIIVDPPYVDPCDYDAAVHALRTCAEFGRETAVLLWYPLLPRRLDRAFDSALLAAGRSNTALFRCSVNPRAAKLWGCGLALLNPSRHLVEALEKELKVLTAGLAEDSNGRLDLLTP